MKQFYALLFLLTALFPLTGNTSVLSNLEVECPDYTVTVTIDQQPTSCKNPYGGKVTAALKNESGGNATGNFYQYTWYEADNPTTRFGTGTSISKVPPGTYFATVRDTRNGCTFRSATVTLSQPQTPWFEIEFLENVIGCNAEPYGRVKFRSENRWKARWYHGDQANPNNGIPKYMSLDHFENLPPGTYTVIYEDPETGCFSDPFTFTIEGWPITPVVNASIVADTTCTGGSGAIQLTSTTPAPGTEPEFGYMYEWRDANGNLLSQFNNQATASPLLAGTYTVTVTGDYSNDSFECGSETSFTVPHQPESPEITLTPAPNYVCDPSLGNSNYNGSITINVTYKGQPVTNFSNYSFDWTGADGNTGSVNGTNIIPNLNGGTYTVTATEVSIGCDSDQATTTVNNQLPAQTLDLATVAQTNCGGTPNGSITATYSISPASTAGYQLEWFYGTSATGTPFTTGVTGDIANSLEGGRTYTVRATDLSSGCQVISSAFVPLQQGVVTVRGTAYPNTICAPVTAVNGRIEIDELHLNGSLVTDY
ncbi:MAG: hypothetical protein KY428_08305, partial [Bacteroidetes bacterium]|nr:hypothetical protein [Bacteroidota bacterium]